MTFVQTTQLPYLSDEKYLNKLIIELLIKNKGIVLNIVILSIIFTIISSIYAMYSGFIIDTITSTNTNLEIKATPIDNEATYEIINGTNLEVGTSDVIIRVTAKNKKNIKDYMEW